MNQPTMTNEQFALWISQGLNINGTPFEKAQKALDWLNKNSQQPKIETLTPKKK